MTEYAVLTAIGEDRPGLVNEISKLIHQAGCNIEDSRMAVLGGDFAMLILVAGEKAGLDKVRDAASATGQRVGLTVQMRPTHKPGMPAKALPYDLRAYAMDHPGIVQRVAEYLAARKINIRAMDTRVTEAPHTGQPLFSLHAQVDIPAPENVAEIRRGLSAIGAEENIDLELKPAQG
ncbi:MAG: glycine cleavage system protein R [Deltaproteobacteria bacterium]|nr:glycine cleavage system protein R [Deltaproteobacteria bacterium]